MSTLTKILIVLLTLSTIYLCGSVVTYVATAENYKEIVSGLKTDLRAANAVAENEKEKYLNEKDLKTQLGIKLEAEIAALEDDKIQMQVNLTKLESKKNVLELEVSSWVKVVQSFSSTTDERMAFLAEKLRELKEVRAEQIAATKEIGELHTSLVEKVTYISTLENQKKQLIEQKIGLQGKLDVLLRADGDFDDVKITHVTSERGLALPADSPVLEDALKGKVTEVNIQNKIVGISIGSADGVQQGMKFYVTRGEDFVCEILIMNVDSKVSAGVIELASGQPKIGDKVATDL